MAFPSRVALATMNPGKIREILAICKGWPVEWIASTASPSPWPTVKETGSTYFENALLKAHVVAEALGLPALADDSGIEVDALEGAPGPWSARFAGEDASDEDNLRRLIQQVRGVGPDRRTARYRCVAVCCWPDGRNLWAEGVCEGALILEPRGTGGFGYDPIFVPAGERRTMAEFGPDEKNAVSHRGKAFRALGDALGA